MDEVELFDPNNRWRHRHPGEKAALAGGMLLLAISLPPGLVTALITVLMVMAALSGARVSWRRFFGGVAVPAGFLFTGVLPILISLTWIPDHTLPRLRLNLVAAGEVINRGLAATTCLIFFATTTSISDILHLLRAARCPDFVLELIMLSYRFALALVQTARSVRLAQRLRLGYHSRTAGIRSLGLLAANLLPRSIDRAKRLAQGLESRGYDGQLSVLSSMEPISWQSLAAILSVQIVLGGLGILSAGSTL
jgi:cobalt/nickel transport system permease protein